MLKRCFDFVVTLTFFLIFWPFLLLLLVIVRLKLGAQPLFIQERPGKDGKIFKMVKFRTMTNETDDRGNLLPDDKRLTKLGKFMRATSLDELPELWNVLKGEMSLVGPRPLLVSYLDKYSDEQARRHEVRPGITGWAQVNGRNAISWEQKFEYDVWYVDNHSFSLDIKILFLTVRKVFKREGIQASENVTMPEFKGSRKK